MNDAAIGAAGLPRGPGSHGGGSHGAGSLEQETMRRVTWRLLPVLMAGYFCAALDRANVGMAATTMSPALHFSNTQFGFGAGIFFCCFLLLELPSNLILDRVVALLGLARILVTLGLISGLTSFLWND